jgi:hypothetical protein
MTISSLTENVNTIFVEQRIALGISSQKTLIAEVLVQIGHRIPFLCLQCNPDPCNECGPAYTIQTAALPAPATSASCNCSDNSLPLVCIVSGPHPLCCCHWRLKADGEGEILRIEGLLEVLGEAPGLLRTSINCSHARLEGCCTQPFSSKHVTGMPLATTKVLHAPLKSAF